MTKLEAFTEYMSQFASHRGADMQWIMDASSHGRIFSYAWDEATKAEREACAKVCDDWLNGRDDVCLLADAIRARGEK
jgi:hypothetical protein